MQTLYKAFRAEGKITNPREDVMLFKTLSDDIIHFNTTRVIRLNPTDPFDLSRAETEARRQVWEMYTFLKENVPAFADSRLLMTAADIGVRESRMADGLYRLTGAELKTCPRFADGIAFGNYDIDIHNPDGTGTSHYFFGPGEYYAIPYRCLVPKTSVNSLVAGRCISVDHEAPGVRAHHAHRLLHRRGGRNRGGAGFCPRVLCRRRGYRRFAGGAAEKRRFLLRKFPARIYGTKRIKAWVCFPKSKKA